MGKNQTIKEEHQLTKITVELYLYLRIRCKVHRQKATVVTTHYFNHSISPHATIITGRSIGITSMF